MSAADLRSGKTHRDENFPVASWIIRPQHRAPILAFYNFVRTADDIADHAALAPQEKLALLDELGAELTGSGESQPEAATLRRALAERGLSPQHALDLLTAFRLDVTKLRYDNWDDLIGYCSYSAMPVGRFVLDVHGESRDTWAASDALCAALQINNHLQDCGNDYRDLDRVYIPATALAVHGATVEMLAAAKAPPPLLSCIHDLAERTEALIEDSASLVPAMRDGRLACELSVIDAYARRIVKLLQQRDPLSERVHLNKWEMLGLSFGGVLMTLLQRLRPRPPAQQAGRA